MQNGRKADRTTARLKEIFEMKLGFHKAGLLKWTTPVIVGTVLMTTSVGSAMAEGQWWTSSPAIEDAKVRLYRIKGVRSVFIHQDSTGANVPHLVVDKLHFSLAQQKAACEILWNRYEISAAYDFQGYLEEDQIVVPLDCAEEYPELSPQA